MPTNPRRGGRRCPSRRKSCRATLKRSPREVRRTYEKTLDSAHDQYDSEQRAHRTAWSAVKHVAEKKGDHWEPKKETGPSDEQAARGGRAARDRPVRTRGGINANKPKRELYDDARRAGIAGRSRMDKHALVEALERHSRRETAKARR